MTWWSGPTTPWASTHLTPVFDIRDIVLVGYALFAMALGIGAGTIVRRTLPAMAVTLAGYIGVRAQ